MTDEMNGQRSETYVLNGMKFERTTTIGMTEANITLTDEHNNLHLALEVKFPDRDPENDVCTVAHSAGVSDHELLGLIDYEAEALFQKLVERMLDKSTETTGDNIVGRLYDAVSRALDAWSKEVE